MDDLSGRELPGCCAVECTCIRGLSERVQAPRLRTCESALWILLYVITTLLETYLAHETAGSCSNTLFTRNDCLPR